MKFSQYASVAFMNAIANSKHKFAWFAVENHFKQRASYEPPSFKNVSDSAGINGNINNIYNNIL